MNKTIYPCITIKGQIAAASGFYINTFEETKILQTSPWVIQLELGGQKFMLLNEGPSSTPNPSVSFMVMAHSAEETERYWNKLIEGGKTLMPLDAYPWSAKYGWLEDKYGASWQLYTNDADTKAPQKVCPTLMFTGANAGKATEAIHFYTSVFPQSRIEGILNYSSEDGENTSFVKHAQFIIKDFMMMAMDSSFEHGFGFNDAISLVVECETQTEIDHYWDKLISDGGQEVACGWLTDKYGLSWQIVPKILGKLMSDPQRAPQVMNAMMQMKKLNIAELENA